MEISILMVDDDRILVEKLEETVDWKRIGISMVFTANNIRQAQKILEEFPIQILLCVLICHKAVAWNCWNGYEIRKYKQNVFF